MMASIYLSEEHALVIAAVAEQLGISNSAATRLLLSIGAQAPKLPLTNKQRLSVRPPAGYKLTEADK